MTPEENEAMTRVGPGTPGGEMLRRYWWPVWLTEELGDRPVEIRHLGEDFVLFRDGGGQVGLLGLHCPHRGASLGLGRVEADGLRCCYHGWKFARDGRCLEMPAEPPGTPLLGEVRQRAGTVREVAGLVFAYIGPDPVPELPRYDLLFREDCHREVWAKTDHCNWAQRAENGVDPYHSQALHAAVYPSIALKRAEVEWERTWYGFRQCSRYPGKLTNISHHIFPSSTRRHGARVGTVPSEYFHMRVPTEDALTTTFYVKANIAPEGPYRLVGKGFIHNQRGVLQPRRGRLVGHRLGGAGPCRPGEPGPDLRPLPERASRDLRPRRRDVAADGVRVDPGGPGGARSPRHRARCGQERSRDLRCRQEFLRFRAPARRGAGGLGPCAGTGVPSAPRCRGGPPVLP